MFDMVVAEDIGLYKFDILSQRGLGKIKETVEIVRYNRPDIPPIDIHDIKRFKEDKKIKYLLKKCQGHRLFLCGISRYADAAKKVTGRQLSGAGSGQFSHQAGRFQIRNDERIYFKVSPS